MTTAQAWLLVIVGRLKCRWWGYHLWQLGESHGYRTAWCRRCWASGLEG